MQKTFLKVSIIFSFMHISGCSVTSRPDYPALGLVQVSGTVSVDGTPLPDVEVRFQTREDSTYSSGKTDARGRYLLMFDSETPGIIPGKKQVILVVGTSNIEESSEGDFSEDSNSTVQVSTGAVPKCYGRDSKVEVEVNKSDSKFDIDFKSDCSTVSR